MIYKLTLFNDITGELEIPLIALTQRKRIDEDGFLETSMQLTVPAGHADSIIEQAADEIRIYQDGVLKWSGDFVSIEQTSTTAILQGISTTAAPTPTTLVIDRVLALFVGSNYDRVRIPYALDLNPGDTVETGFVSLAVQQITSRYSIREAFSEVINAAG